jgi:hypothetical protein
MATKERILLVEGESDRAFFEVICRKIGLDKTFTVAPPKDLAGTHNTKEGVFNYLPTLLAQLNDGSVTRLGVVVDADSPPHSDFDRVRDRMTTLVSRNGYTLSSATADGLIYASNDGLADFGLWVMPDNGAHGVLEDWLKQCVHDDEQQLFNHAVGVVAALPTPPFR